MDAATADELFAEWVAGANALALLRAAYSTGVLMALREPTSVEALASKLELDSDWTAILCQGLDAHGIVEYANGGYRTADGFLALDGEDRASTLGDRLGFIELLRRAIASGAERAPGFATVSEEESFALARGVWGRPTSPAALASWAELDSAIPEAKSLWEHGARHAEFGCGLGRDLLRIVVMYPSVTAVGYELMPHIAEETRREAERLAVADRLTIETRDVLTVDGEDEFDSILWSQMFFPLAQRPRVIEIIRRALRPGGVLTMPIMPDLPDPSSTPGETPVRLLLTAALAYRRWEIYWVPEASIVAELETFGFAHLRTVPHVRGTPFVVMQLGPNKRQTP
jgi:SAM-dependent methyltransferase